MKKTKVGQALIAALEEALEHAQGKIDLRTTELVLPDEPPKLSKMDVKKIRDSLHVSQPVFARYLGVSAEAVKAWEQGHSHPSGAAVRLLQIAAKEPNGFPRLITESAAAGGRKASQKRTRLALRVPRAKSKLAK